MRLIGQLDEGAEWPFARYLSSQGIEFDLERSQTEPAVGSHVPRQVKIWVVDEDLVDRAKALFSRYLAMPDAAEFHRP